MYALLDQQSGGGMTGTVDPGVTNLRSTYHTGRYSGCSVRRMTVKPGWARKRPTTARLLPPTTEKPDQAQAPGERSSWRLNRDEQRTLIITFVGGLGSIVAAACFIGGAIALARYESFYSLGAWAALTGYWVLVFVALVLIRRLRRVRARRRGRSVSVSVMEWFALLCGGFGVVLALTVWIGLAAGIK
jgi:hypothetical protein